MKKIIISAVLVGLVGCDKQPENKTETDREKMDNIINSKAQKILKTNDLIFACELRRSMSGDVSDDVVQEEAINNNEVYRKFSLDIKNTTPDNRDTPNAIRLNNTTLLDSLCSYHVGNHNLSVYSGYLLKKYDTEQLYSSVEQVGLERLTVDDRLQWAKAKQEEKKLRLSF